MSKTCSRRGCQLPSKIQRPDRQYCYKHHRFREMRGGARRHRKYIPSWETLDRMLPNDLICRICKKRMIWHANLGQFKDVITLQHNHDGSIALICHACNSGHGGSQLGDAYFDVPSNEKYCPGCKKLLHKSSFHIDRSQANGLHSQCKECRKEIWKAKKAIING